MLAACAAATLTWAAAASAEPAIARPTLPSLGVSAEDARGLVFFVAGDATPGIVAIGTAHTIPLAELVRGRRVEFALPASHARVGRSERFAAPPGRPFPRPDASLRDDYFVFALADGPHGVRALEARRGERIASGDRVRLLGPDPRGERDEVEARGHVVAATPDRIEIELDLPRDLAGWGGAPVLVGDSDRVVGIVEAAVPGAAPPRVLAAPIDGALDALAEPLEDGGRAFAAFRDAEASPPPSDADAGSGGSALLSPTAGTATQVELEIEYPPDGAAVSETVCGSFVAGRAAAVRGTRRRFDIMLVLDTSYSTRDAAGADVNGNGVVGEAKLGGLGSMFGAELSDPGDSILAAEVAAARQVIRGLDPRSTRVGLVAFAGDALAGTGSAARKPAYTIEALTNDYARVERGLEELLAASPSGQTHMAAGIDQATVELAGMRGAYSVADPDSEKIVFFFTDGQPTLPYGPDAEADNVRAVLRASTHAVRGGIRIHSFAIGPEALAGPIAAVEMAGRTGGHFTPVRDPGDLVDVVDEVSFANLGRVRLEQVNSGAEAEPFRLSADGSWAGFLPLEAGRNRVRVTAVAEDGTSLERAIDVVRAGDDEAEAPLPSRLLAQRNRLLEDCLVLARERRLEQERLRNEEIRRALRVEIERERRKARERAAEQRKTLELDTEEE